MNQTPAAANPTYSLPKNPTHSLPNWYQVYFAAVLEPDEWKALIEIDRARHAIEDRLTQLRCSAPDNPREPQDLDSALIYLGLLAQNIEIGAGSLL
jgi:hypothetical protein